jgi:hypothetical protein
MVSIETPEDRRVCDSALDYYAERLRKLMKEVRASQLIMRRSV